MELRLRRAVVLLLAGALALSASGCRARATASDQVTVEAVAAHQGKVTATVEVTGALVPARTANVSSKLAGQVKTVRADVGDRVQAGQLLVEIDTRELQAQLQQAEAGGRAVRDQAEQARLGMEAAQIGVANAKASLDATQKYYDRTKFLADAGAVPQSQLDEAQTKLEQARNGYEAAKKQYEVARKQYEMASGSALAQAEAAVNTVKVNLSNASITSPISGIVTNRNVNPGEMASPALPLLTIADASTLKFEGTVGQEVVPLLAVGQEVTVTVDALPGPELTGTVTQVGPVATSTGQLFPVEITLTNPGDLKAGMTARASIRIISSGGVVIPAAAVRTDNGQHYVFVVEDGAVERRPVTLGLRNDTEVLVLDGVEAGQRVAVTNVDALQDGMAVMVQ